MSRFSRLAIAIGIILSGIGIAVYPFVSNHLYENRQKEVISDYDKKVQDTEKDRILKERERAIAYNDALRATDVIMTDPFDPEALTQKTSESYESLLNLHNDGVMGYLRVPALDLYLNIYHGTGTRVLERGVGHLEMTSLPVGGAGTHAVLSAHAGLPEKKLFTDLEQLEKGDTFFLHVLDEVLAYEVDQIKVVNPDVTEDLLITSGKDYVTLLTCTPYGVNSHRLLVRGTRIPYEEATKEQQIAKKKIESPWMRQYFKGVLTGFFILFVIFVVYVRIRKRGAEDEE